VKNVLPSETREERVTCLHDGSQVTPTLLAEHQAVPFEESAARADRRPFLLRVSLGEDAQELLRSPGGVVASKVEQRRRHDRFCSPDGPSASYRSIHL
jgi:hypothetical protein